MSFQWIEMRISEEKDRRTREDIVRARLPLALEQLLEALAGCAQAFNNAFEDEKTEVQARADSIRVAVRSSRNGVWTDRGSVKIVIDPQLPGFSVVNGGDPQSIQVGILGGDKIFYKFGERYLSIEEVTKLILDRVMFPSLDE